MLKAFSNKKTVDGVLAAFAQTIVDLETVQREQHANAEAAEQARIEAEARRDAHEAESRRARAVADQIKNLILG